MSVYYIYKVGYVNSIYNSPSAFSLFRCLPIAPPFFHSFIRPAEQHTQREEIEVSKLIGATSAFIRRPFLYYGAVQGLAGGLAAWLVVDGGISLLNNNVSQLAALYASDYRLHLLNIDGGLILLCFAALLGWLGAYLSVSLHLRKIEPR